MAVYEFEGKRPMVGRETYISESAEIIGEVAIGRGCYIGPGAKIKGDYGKVVIGDRTSVQENCVLHARPGDGCVVGNMVNVGHGSILHNCTVKDYAVIGMGAIISDWAVVGIWSVVGEGCVVKQHQEIPDGKVCVGVPAKVVADVTDEYKKEWGAFKELYVELAQRYAKGMRKVQP